MTDVFFHGSGDWGLQGPEASWLVPHESQFSVLQMPVFSSGCILTAGTGPGTSHSPIPAQRGETGIALAGIGQGAAGRQTDDTQLHPLDLI